MMICPGNSPGPDGAVPSQQLLLPELVISPEPRPLASDADPPGPLRDVWLLETEAPLWLRDDARLSPLLEIPPNELPLGNDEAVALPEETTPELPGALELGSERSDEPDTDSEEGGNEAELPERLEARLLDTVDELALLERLSRLEPRELCDLLLDLCESLLEREPETLPDRLADERDGAIELAERLELPLDPGDEIELPILLERSELEVRLLLDSDELRDEFSELENELLRDELDRDPGQHGQPGIFFIVMAYSGGQYSTSMTGRQFSFLHWIICGRPPSCMSGSKLAFQTLISISVPSLRLRSSR